MKARTGKTNARKVRTARSKSAGLKIPQILLEGDEPALVQPAELPPPIRFSPPTPEPPLVEPEPKALPATEPPPAAKVAPPPSQVTLAQEKLPEAYGTKRLVLTARDPRWLYAHWDFTREQLEECNSRSAGGHLILRLYQEDSANIADIPVHPESRNWFVPVPQPGARYHAELGFYPPNAGPWTTISNSAPVTAPPAELSTDTSVEFKTLLPDTPAEEIKALAKLAVDKHIPVKQLIQQLKTNGGRDLPGGPKTPRRLTSEQEQALSEMVIVDEIRRISVSSLDIEEVLHREVLRQAAAIANAPIEAQDWSGVVGLPSSPSNAQEQPRGFWFNINAEMVIYGATDPNANVTIGGRPVTLRPDGTFSFRFALPDGDFVLPAEATDGVETRSATLRFSRITQYKGHVAPHPQSPELKPPLVENL
jgi:uncharacterized protein